MIGNPYIHPKEIRIGTLATGRKTFPERANKGKVCRPYESLFNRARKFAPIRKGKTLNWEITYEEFLKFVEQKFCHYCEAVIPWSLPHGGRDEDGVHRLAYHLERVNNEEGYSVENCVVACGECNLARGSRLSYREMLVVGRMRKEERENNAGTQTTNSIRFDAEVESCIGSEC